MSKVQQVVFLSARSGGGHDGTARAFAAWMERAGSCVRANIVDVYGDGLRALPWMARVRQHSNLAWRAFTATMSWPPLLRLARAVLRPMVLRRCARAITERPDLIVATHFVGAQFAREIAARFDPPVRTIIVASDYEPHAAWFGDADVTIVSNPLGVRRARLHGTPERTIFPVELLPAAPAPARATPRTSRGATLWICAVMGADGTSAGRLLRVLEQLERTWPEHGSVDVEVICGRNEGLRSRLSRATVAYRRVRVHAVGFVNDVQSRLACADVALLRASPLVLTEAVGQGTPVLAFDWHAHEGAVEKLIARWDCGSASRSPAAIARQLRAWDQHRDQLRRVRDRARRIAGLRFDDRAIRALIGDCLAAAA